MTNVIQAIQTTLTYSNLAFQLITGEVNDIAKRLDLPETIPVQTASDFQFTLEGKTVGVSGSIETEKFKYEFRNGAVQEIMRTDFNRYFDVSDPFLSHLTNEVLVLTKDRAEARAFEILSQLSFDIEKLKKFYDVKVKDDLMSLNTIDPERKKSGLPSKSSRYSKKKIQVEVVFTRKGTDQYGAKIKFIATTGEFISLFAWGEREMRRLGIIQKQLVINDASDLALPTFFIGEVTDSTSWDLEESKIVSLVRDAVIQVQQSVGTNKPKGFLVWDNLNAPELVARELKNGLTNAFFAGVSTLWRTNLPFSRKQQDAVSKNKRGIYIVGFSGDFKTEFKKFQAPAKQSRTTKNKTAVEDSKHSRELMDALFKKLKLSEQEKTLFVSLGNARLGFPSVAFSEAATGRGATVFPDMISDFNPDFLYWNGDVESNSRAFLRISGELPFSKHGIDFSQFEPLTRTRFEANPLEEITDQLGLETIEIMRQAERVETIRVRRSEEEDAKARFIDDYVLIGTGQQQGSPFAHALSKAIINEKNQFGWGKMCLFDPGVIFRLWRGKEMVKVTICFNCQDMKIQCFDSTGEKMHSTFFDFSANRAPLVRLCKMAFPKDGAIQRLNEKG